MIVLITPVISKNFETILTILTQRANLVPCHLLFLLILRGWEARRNPWWHSIMFRTWCHALALSSFNQIAPIIHVVNIFVLLLFFYFSSVQTKFILNYWNKSDDFWDRLWPSQLSQLSESVSIWPLQNFTQLSRLSGIELKSIQGIKVIPVI